jgi:hypothetical protein
LPSGRIDATTLVQSIQCFLPKRLSVGFSKAIS